MVPIRFYSHTRGEHRCFSNFSEHPINSHGMVWPTSEHLFQALKFLPTDPDWFLAINGAATPAEAKRKGRSRRHPIRDDWEESKDEIMKRILTLKVEQHEDVRDILLETGDTELIEAAPRDYYWGVGATGTGQNKLGLLWMEVRKELRNQV